MCGIIGIFEPSSEEKVREALNLLSERGRDGHWISIEKTYCLGHTLHSVVGRVKQPIKSRFVANCEIYNWKELDKNSKNDAETLFNLLEKLPIKEVLNKIDGDYAFAHIKSNILHLARDIIGVKPLFYTKKPFAFASEKKVLEKLGYEDVQELNPREILRYNIKTKKISFVKRNFFKIVPENKETYEKQREKVKQLLIDSIKKRIPNKKFGLLFSGGIDSVILAYYFKKLGLDFTCYTSALDTKEEPEDLIYAKKIAKELNLNLKYKKIKLEEVESYLNKIVPLIEDNNPVKVSIALTFYIASELAKEDGIKVIFSGLAAEDIFAGYQRHRQSKEVNKECISGLLKVYERDTYRDDVVTMHNNLELRVPYLDKNLIEYVLKIPARYKINEKSDKYILRDLIFKEGLREEFAFRPKKAAQYGSKFDKAIEKLAGKKSKSEYLKQFYNKGNVKLGVLFSSGKDSCYAAYIMKKQNYDLSCLITIRSKNPDSYMFHTPNIHLTELQAKAMQIPIITKETSGKKEDELKDLENALKEAKEKYKIEGIVSGALFSDYQRSRIEKIADKLSLKVFCPLWHKDQETEMRELLKNNFKVIFSSIAAEGFDKCWLNKVITNEDIDKLVKLNKKYGINIAGEGGEFESLVLDCPLFNKKLEILDYEIKEENKNTARLTIKKAKLSRP